MLHDKLNHLASNGRVEPSTTKSDFFVPGNLNGLVKAPIWKLKKQGFFQLRLMAKSTLKT